MTAAVFVDTNFLIALLVPKDQLHDRAIALAQEVDAEAKRWVTTELVLVELLNGLADKGPAIRERAVLLVKKMRAEARTRVVPHSTDLFIEALDFYKSRPDKTWGFVDCASFCVMERHRITEALTHDRDFEQAGYRALLRAPPQGG